MLLYGCTRLEVGVQSIYEDGELISLLLVSNSFSSRKRHE